MGRGNVCVHGPYEGLYYIDNDDLHVYLRKDADPDDDDSRIMLGKIEYSELDKYEFDDVSTAEEITDAIWDLQNGMISRFHSFERCDTWISRSQRAILENKLFYVCEEDNEWSLAIELIQKESPWGEELSGLQKRHYEKYLNGIRDTLFERFYSLGAYGSAWTHRLIVRPES